jgi:hypothetical protein
MNSSYYEKPIKPLFSTSTNSKTQLNVAKSSILNEYSYIKIQRSQYNTEKSTVNSTPSSNQYGKSLNSFTYSINSQSDSNSTDDKRKYIFEKAATEKSEVLEDDNEYEEKINLSQLLSKPVKNLSIKPKKSSLKKPKQDSKQLGSIIKNQPLKLISSQYFSDNYSVPEQSTHRSLKKVNKYGNYEINNHSQNNYDNYPNELNHGQIRLPFINNLKKNNEPNKTSSINKSISKIKQTQLVDQSQSQQQQHHKKIYVYTQSSDIRFDNQNTNTYVKLLQPIDYNYIQKPAVKYLEKYPNELNKKNSINDAFLFNRYFYRP